MWSNIVSVFNTHQRFVISSHVNPDCDALGSELALARYLINQGKTVAILNTDPVPETYRFLDPQGLIQTFSENAHAHLIYQADVIVVVDVSGGWQRLGRVGEALAQARDTVSVCIDHHPDGAPFTRYSHVNPVAAAAGELIFDLLTTMQATITQPIAEALYVAILTDTGGFRFASTGANTHRIIARLIECGADPAYLYRNVYEQYPLSKLRLKGYVLQNIVLTPSKQVAYVGLTLEVLQRYNVASSELDGFSNLGQQIAGVKIAVFAVELSRGRVKLSLRSDGSVAVNKLAAKFGGGGHVPAAGITTSGSLAEVLKAVVAEAETAMMQMA